MFGQKQRLRLAAFAIALISVAPPVWAKDKTADEIMRELTPTQQQMKAHSWSPNMSLEIVAPGQPPAPAYTPPPQAAPNPHANIIVQFDFGSAVVKTQSFSQLRELATGFNRPEYANYKFVIVGYTDAKGSDAQNFRLSVLRAAAVYDVLTTHFGVSPGRLYLQGMGKNNLRGSPDAAENRRVEIVNLL